MALHWNELGQQLGSAYEKDRKTLMAVHGIWPKVADCIYLFALTYYEAWPRDT